MSTQIRRAPRIRVVADAKTARRSTLRNPNLTKKPQLTSRRDAGGSSLRSKPKAGG